jgi:2-keto-4-pentenoate hydratase
MTAIAIEQTLPSVDALLSEDLVVAGPVGLTSREHHRLAAVLLSAARSRRAVDPLTDSYPELTLADAYRISNAVLARRIAEGERLIGAKVTGTEPRLGWLTDVMLPSSSLLDLGELIHPRVTVGVAIVLARTLPGPAVTAGDVLAAAGEVIPCLEIVDSRYDVYAPSAADEIADNCSAARLLFGERLEAPSERQLHALRVEFETRSACDPRPVRSTRVADPLTEAVRCANWLLQGAAELPAGTLLLLPTGHRAVALEPGVSVRASFAGGAPLELEMAHRA